MKKLISFVIMLSLLGSCGLNELEDDISGINDRLSQVEKDVDVLQKDVELLKTDVQQLGEDGKLYAFEIKHLNLVFDQLSQILEVTQTGDSLSSTAVEGLQLLLASFLEHSDTENLNTTLSNWIAQIELATSDVDSLTNANHAISSNIEVIQEMVNGLNTEINTLKAVSVDQTLNGNVFKGPFNKGSQLTFYEMNDHFFLTGRTFSSTIDDEYGTYSLKISNARGKLFQVVADGFYWNEVTALNSNSRISLSGVFRIDSVAPANVNILTHLEKPRVEYLVSGGMAYDSAKVVALNEVLGALGIDNPGVSRSEDITLAKPGNVGKVAFAISTLIQGFRTESEVTEILTDLSNDIKNDGLLTDISLGNDLMSHLHFVDTTSVKQGFIGKYQNVIDPEVLASIDLKYLGKFIASGRYQKDLDLITFDQYVKGCGGMGCPWENLLSHEVTTITGTSTGVNCNITRDGMKLKVEIVNASDGTFPLDWGFFTSLNEGWTLFQGNNGVIIPKFETTGKGKFDIPLNCTPGNYIIRFYEKDGVTPTRTKSLLVN